MKYRLIVSGHRVLDTVDSEIAVYAYDRYIQLGYSWVLLNRRVESGPDCYWVVMKGTVSAMKGENYELDKT